MTIKQVEIYVSYVLYWNIFRPLGISKSLTQFITLTFFCSIKSTSPYLELTYIKGIIPHCYRHLENLLKTVLL